MIWKMERMRLIRAQLEEQVRIYNEAYAVRAISQAQENYALLGIDAAQHSITASYGPLGRYFNRINIGAVESMIGFAGDGSPLNDLLKMSYPDAVDGLMQALINGVALGKGSGQIAQDMADGMGMGLERALLISRTETMRAYRTASTEQYRQSGVVTGFKRLVKKATACMACLMLDGETFRHRRRTVRPPTGQVSGCADRRRRGRSQVADRPHMVQGPDARRAASPHGSAEVRAVEGW